MTVIPVFLAGQFSYSGQVNPSNLYRVSDGTEISLPFRLAEAEVVYSRGVLDLRLNMAWETRWSAGLEKSRLDFREAYLSWYPAFGEIRLGKQIHAWGAVDGNNPTDNLSAYDYYYLFFPGTARKIGSVSLSVTGYFGDWKIQGVLIPDHEPNRLPFNEPDFPISLPPEPAKSLWSGMPDSVEWGFRVSNSSRFADVAISYFGGRDRIFSPVRVLLSRPTYLGPYRFGYRETEVMGVDWVTFIGRFTLRGEGGYFRTMNDHDAQEYSVKLDMDATYVQYVVQLEYPGPWEINLMGQFIGQTVLSVEGTTWDPVTGDEVPFEKEDFHAGLGTPFAMFVDRAFLAAADGFLLDRRLEFSVITLVSLEETGYMAGLSVDYSPVENWHVESGLNLFRGGRDPEGTNLFKDLEEFSHLRVGLKYSF